MTLTNGVYAQEFDLLKMNSFEKELEDVMEITDLRKLKLKLKEVETEYSLEPTNIQKVRLGLIYHETALNLSFLANSEHKGYALKSYTLLTELSNCDTIPCELLPFIASYQASALSLVSAETKKLKLLGEAFDLFEKAVREYADVSYLPEFLRGSVSENLPRLFFSKRKFAKKDFQSIINKYEKNNSFANWKIMSFTYWAWAKQHQQKKFRVLALNYLDLAIELDPNNEAAKSRAEILKSSLGEDQGK